MESATWGWEGIGQPRGIAHRNGFASNNLRVQILLASANPQSWAKGPRAGVFAGMSHLVE
jgi:hypothetical protein